jgi:hypothetical protein
MARPTQRPHLPVSKRKQSLSPPHDRSMTGDRGHYPKTMISELLKHPAAIALCQSIEATGRPAVYEAGTIVFVAPELAKLIEALQGVQ